MPDPHPANPTRRVDHRGRGVPRPYWLGAEVVEFYVFGFYAQGIEG